MCGLPGEREADLDGMLNMAETISRLGKETTGRWATVVANVSNFVPEASALPVDRDAAAGVFSFPRHDFLPAAAEVREASR